MSEYQRYEFMTCDRPLTRAQLDAVNKLSSHIEASSTHALIEYHWGDFKHDPIDVLHRFFDGFLYWANWGSPRLAFRFPHGVLPADLIEVYDFDDDYVMFTRHKDYDILDIHFHETEPSDYQDDYELSSFIAIRDELMEGDLRALYIVWLACMAGMEDYEEGEEEEEEYELPAAGLPAVPPGFDKLTDAQKELADLLGVPDELLAAAGRHSSPLASAAAMSDDLVAWVKLLSQDRCNDYLLRLARNEPGLSLQLVKELRALGKDETKVQQPQGKYVTYTTLFKESKTIRETLAREQREKKEQARLRRLQEVHEKQEDYWRQVEQGVARSSGAGYEEAASLLSELRDAAVQFGQTSAFQARFTTWVQPLLRRTALVKRLRDHKFMLPKA